MTFGNSNEDGEGQLEEVCPQLLATKNLGWHPDDTFPQDPQGLGGNIHKSNLVGGPGSPQKIPRTQPAGSHSRPKAAAPPPREEGGALLFPPYSNATPR